MPESTEGVAVGTTTTMDYENEAFRLNDGENGEDICQNRQRNGRCLRLSSMCAFGTLLVEEQRLM